ncbi:hypothetical protein DAETH_18910 [Deinococcus aetherius]|uniref:Uncharacterized protein n=1 Tax=Deinococcus aetherius TaxID=200252 RepID=A0ABN6REY5_9DEIO|nr:hypothetical protein [Deinococcus aetherius]BDP41922.1 hypothetical protein DAETH_18910 [Deinococcus aetherius]
MRGLLPDLFLGGVPGVVLLLYSIAVVVGSFAVLKEASFDGMGLSALMFLLGTLGVFACLSLLAVLLRFARGTQASLKPRMAASLRWGLVTGIILTAAVIFLLVFDLFQRGTGVDGTTGLICALVLAPAMVAAKYIRLLQKVGG